MRNLSKNRNKLFSASSSMIYDCDRDFKSEKFNDFNNDSPDCKNEDY